MIIKKIESSDIDQIILIHMASFKGFFLTNLGISFLKVFYKSIIQSKESICLCSFDNLGIINGFCVGSLNSKGFYFKLIKQNFLPFSLQFIIILFKNPKAIFRLLKNFKKRANNIDGGDYAEILSIAVYPEKANLGIGKNLLSDFENEVRKKYVTKIALTTDFENNENTLHFYFKNGYEVFYQFTTFPSRKMYKLIKKI